ncbi:MAG: 4-alpha-glucanotransferase [Propionibacteriaceae bacterium]
MPLIDPALRELAGLYQISTEFWDWKGRHTEVDDASVIAVLAGFEVDASTPEKAREAVDTYHKRTWQRALPPCLVIEQGVSTTFPVHVHAGATAQVFIRLEEGGSLDAAQVDNFTPDRKVDGEWLGEASFGVPLEIPLGYHRVVLRTDDREVESALIVTPSWLGFPRQMGAKRIWGYATQLYSVASRDSWGVGDLADLADLAVWSSTQQYASYILINPLHAAQPVAPMEPSPYLPSSRRYVNPLYIRPEAIEEYASLTTTERSAIRGMRRDLADDLARSEAVERDATWDAKREALELVFRAGRKTTREMAFSDFQRREGRQLRDFATWCALSERFGRSWREWPESLRRPSSPEVAEFAGENAELVTFYTWLQWIADTQLSSAQQAAKDTGMALGIISDLAVGVNADGAETWALNTVFANGVSVGAPPDPYNQSGQDWGQPPWRPDRLADLAYAPFRSMVNGILRHSGGVRVDHIIGLFRLWWIPQGHGPQQGAYVRYDHEALVGILALEAHRAGALVIGEDLGTVEPWARDYLRRRGILGTSILWFEYDSEGKPLAPEYWREYCMASVTTHDLPPTAGYLAHDHVRLRYQLGLLTESLDSEIEADAREQSAVLGTLEDRGALPADDRDTEDVTLALHRFLTWTPSRVLCVSLTDAVGERRTQNQPGTINEYPNWRVPLGGPDGQRLHLEDLYESDRARRLSSVMNGFQSVPEIRKRSAESTES